MSAEETKPLPIFTTELVKVKRVNSTGVLGGIVLSEYTGKVFTIIRGTISDADVKECKKKWSWMEFEHKDGKRVYRKHIICPDHLYHTLLSHHQANELSKTKLKGKIRD